ncbi:MAG: GNAT family N-acetyltransferase [Planctomycetota bacterium]
MSDRITLRPARPEDSRPIAHLDCALFRYAGLSPRQVSYYRRKSPQLVVVAADREHRLAGFLIACVTRYGEPALHIISMGVITSRRRRGLGRRLLRAAIYRARRAGAVRARLEVWTGNSAATMLYRSLGFETVRRNHDYYEPGRDALVMEKRLSRRR